MTASSRTPVTSPALILVVSVAVALGLVLVQPSAEAARPLPNEKEWRADVREVMSGGRAYLGRRAERGGRHLAINLDIDNTALASHYDHGRATPPVLRFARRAHRLDMAVLFNTARPRGDGNLRRAVRMLRRADYPVTRICGRHRGESVVDGKQRCRREFRNRGYTLVANVGNRRTDFVGRGYERAYRLPGYGGRLK
ncbi:MAG TPA: hypothetical protein VFG72_16840 [Marmoricola sp.]|nr:hypothetical protein [Marmoricola sp.]